mmetsp:Transcript_23014/g.52795  ORF Transcript_23014/g.52795 Transcript_23014/m.52795 type:complete len:221 (-) Transcript_23014:213-875(-)
MRGHLCHQPSPTSPQIATFLPLTVRRPTWPTLDEGQSQAMTSPTNAQTPHLRISTMPSWQSPSWLWRYPDCRQPQVLPRWQTTACSWPEFSSERPKGEEQLLQMTSSSNLCEVRPWKVRTPRGQPARHQPALRPWECFQSQCRDLERPNRCHVPIPLDQNHCTVVLTSAARATYRLVPEPTSSPCPHVPRTAHANLEVVALSVANKLFLNDPHHSNSRLG